MICFQEVFQTECLQSREFGGYTSDGVSTFHICNAMMCFLLDLPRCSANLFGSLTPGVKTLFLTFPRQKIRRASAHWEEDPKVDIGWKQSSSTSKHVDRLDKRPLSTATEVSFPRRRKRIKLIMHGPATDHCRHNRTCIHGWQRPSEGQMLSSSCCLQ